MKPLFTEAEFATATSRQPLPLECEFCGELFYLEKHRIQEAKSSARTETASFCSCKCSIRAMRPLPLSVKCEQCQKPLLKRQCDLTRTKHNFCNQSCAAQWNNAHKTKGTRVSKLELWLQEQLPLLFPSLEFQFNRTDAIEAELDVFIPSLHLAFELNGIFHYEPIYGLKKFASVLKNDQRKMLACAEHGIELCVIDVSSVAYFKPAKAQRFLDIVESLIRTKLSGDSPALLPLPSRNRVEVP